MKKEKHEENLDSELQRTHAIVFPLWLPVVNVLNITSRAFSPKLSDQSLSLGKPEP